MANFTIESSVTALYPQLQVGLVVCRGITNGPASSEVTDALRGAEQQLRQRYSDPEALKIDPTIMSWQEAHRRFGSNPNKFPCSIHALAKRVLKGGQLPSISALVDLYNVVSLRHFLPAGGEDLGRCSGDIRLCLAEGNEDFTALGSDSPEPPEKGEVIYRDNVGVLCRKFNWREAARTCLRPETTDAMLVIEALPPTSVEQLGSALEELAESVSKNCGGSVRSTILTSNEPITVF